MTSVNKWFLVAGVIAAVILGVLVFAGSDCTKNPNSFACSFHSKQETNGQ